jgi:hypothetical protein
VCLSLFSISFSLSEFCAKIRNKNNSLKTLGWVLTKQTTASWKFRFAATLLPRFQTSALCLSLSVRPPLCVCVCSSVVFSVSLSLFWIFSCNFATALRVFLGLWVSPSLLVSVFLWVSLFWVSYAIFCDLLKRFVGRTQQVWWISTTTQQARELDCWPGHANCATRGGKVAWSAKQNQGPNAHLYSNLRRCCRCSCETSCYSC